MPLFELKDFSIELGTTRLSGINLSLEAGAMLALVGRSDSGASLLSQAIADTAPEPALSSGTLEVNAQRLAYLGRSTGVAGLETLLADNPDLIIADHPGAEFDAADQHALLTRLQIANRDSGAAVLIVTSDFRLALSMALDIAVIAEGKLLLRAPASQIAELPKHDAVRALIGAERRRSRTLARPPIGPPLLELSGVSKARPRPFWRRGAPDISLHPTDLVIHQGEALGILGAAGSGKSLLLRLIAGLERPSAGRIGLRTGTIGYVFSDPRRAFNPTLPVGVSLTEPLRVEQSLLVEEQADRLVEMVRTVGIRPEVLNWLPGAFSATELQQLALARALMARPSLLLLDDPTAHLEVAEVHSLSTLISRIRADIGIAAAVVSRDFDVLRTLSDRVVVLADGRIVDEGKPSELTDSSNETTRRLVAPRYPNPLPILAKSADHADEAAETGEIELPPIGPLNAAGSASTADAKPLG